MSLDEDHPGQDDGHSPGPSLSSAAEDKSRASELGDLDRPRESQDYPLDPCVVSDGEASHATDHLDGLGARFLDRIEYDIAGIQSRIDETGVEVPPLAPEELGPDAEVHNAPNGHVTPDFIGLGLVVELSWEHINDHLSPAYWALVVALNESLSIEESLAEAQRLLWPGPGAVARHVRLFRSDQERQSFGIVYSFDAAEDPHAILSAIALSFPQYAQPSTGTPRYPQRLVLDRAANGGDRP